MSDTLTTLPERQKTTDSPAGILSLIGNTPIVELRRVDAGPCRLFAKLEYMNPGGSIKDRIALSMIEGAEAEGRIGPGGTLVEATSGNTGIGLALIGRLKGYRVVIVIPDKMSQEKIHHLRALGAEVLVTRSDVGPGHPEHYQEMARRIAEETDNALYVNQHRNTDNPRAHEDSTGPEILAQMDGKLDAVVCGIGTGGTLTGIGRYLRHAAPGVELVLADPEGSILVDFLATGKLGQAGAWLVEGIGEDVLPPTGDMSLVGKAYTVTDAESMHAARAAARRGHHGGLVHRHPFCRGTALLPRADRAQARADDRARQRAQVPVQDVQRPLDDRSGPAGARVPRRSRRSDRAAPRGSRGATRIARRSISATTTRS